MGDRERQRERQRDRERDRDDNNSFTQALLRGLGTFAPLNRVFFCIFDM